MGVDLRGGHGGVAQELLHAAQVRSPVQQVGGRAVPQAVGAAGAGVRNGVERPRDDPPGYARIDARPSSPEEQGISGARPCQRR